MYSARLTIWHDDKVIHNRLSSGLSVDDLKKIVADNNNDAFKFIREKLEENKGDKKFELIM